MEILTKVIGPEEDGRSVQRVMRRDLGFSARGISRLKQVETGILVNGQRAFTNRILHTGDVLRVEAGDHREPKKPIPAGNWPLPVVWEDGHLLVVDKPAGMTAHASNFDPESPTVGGALAWTRGPDFIFHPVSRLDRGTTGLMIVAKSGYIHDILRRLHHTKHFRREYRAVCAGKPEPESGIIDAPIGREEGSIIARAVREDGAPAVTRYEVLASNGERSFLKLEPQTGRTHQLRVHMASVGCPLAGDWLYGQEEPDLIARPALHSYRLELEHPVTGEWLCLTAPLPDDMARLVEKIR